MNKLLTAIMAMALVLLANNTAARAAINTDCATSPGCGFDMMNTSTVNALYSDGTSGGSITTGTTTGQGVLSVSEGYIIMIRMSSNNVWIHNIATSSTCSINIGMVGRRGLVFGSYAYMVTGGLVKKISLDCTGYVDITAGTTPNALAKVGNTIYVLNNGSGDISTIVPPSETTTTYSIGRNAADNLISIVPGNGQLYINGKFGVYSAPLPLNNTSTLWKALPYQTGDMKTNGTHLALSASLGAEAYLVPIATPDATVVESCTTCRSVAINSDTWYTIGGGAPDVGLRAWDFTGTARSYSPLSTLSTWSVDWYAPPAPVCGDNVTNGTDVCDGADLNGSTCNDFGYDYGTLACNAGCSDFDTTACAMNCGNGSIEAPEQCDGTNYNGATCQTLGFDTGSLACSASCTLDTSGCEMNCGNGSIDTGEDCDGSNLNSTDCVDLGFDSGTLACSGTCTFDTTTCVTLTCGNGSIDNGEECDGLDLNGQTCVSLGHDGGALSCSSSSCTYDTSACTDFVCGNGQIEGTEECDGVNLGTATCQSLGLGTGTLTCSACSFNTSGCATQPVCGNGVREGSEECDDNNLVNGDGCDEFCKNEVPPNCGNGAIDTDEDCDGDNLDGQTCVGLGFTGGSLSCNACSFNTAGCINNPVCNYSGVIEEVTNVTHPDLTGNALEKYTSNTQTLTRSCQISCLDAPITQVVAPAGSYCNVKVTGTDFTVIWHIYTTTSHPTPATIRVPTNLAFTMTRFGGGHILLHDGVDINIGIGKSVEWDEAAVGGTEGTAEMAEFASVHPDTQTPGSWYVINVLTDTMIYCAPGSTTNCAVLTAGKNGRAVLNLDALGDLTQWNLKVDKPPTCNGCNQTSGSSPLDFVLMLVFIGFVIFWLRNRPLVRNRVRVSVSERR